MTHPVDSLLSDHRLIEQVLDALESRLATMENEPFPRRFFDQTLEFLTGFADRYHHGREEDLLFPILKHCGVSEEGGPIGVMLYEHTVGRSHLGSLRENLDAAERGDPGAREAVRAHALGYIELLRQHIQKEDNILFQIARRVLGPADVDRLRTGFTALDERLAAGGYQRYQEPAARLAQGGKP